jgi:hypothetical protein
MVNHLRKEKNVLFLGITNLRRIKCILLTPYKHILRATPILTPEISIIVV